MIPDPEKGRISAPYKLTVAEYRLTTSFPPNDAADWTVSMYKPLKTKIKDYYSIVQNDYCAFCRTKVNFKGYNEPIEHIVHKSSKPTWMFKPINLVLSCVECNTRKGVKNTLRKPYRSVAQIPLISGAYRIVHPHFDNYEQHIIIEDELFYKALDRDKGLFTIIICGLAHFQMLMKRADAIKMETRDLYTRLSHRMSDISVHKAEKKMIRATMNDLVARRQI